MASSETDAAGRPENRAAVIGAYAAFLSVASTGSWLLAGYLFYFITLVCALVAIVAGHIGYFRARRLGGRGRWLALADLLTGWLMLGVCLLAFLALAGLALGLTLLTR
jgi:hypothetical protein